MKSSGKTYILSAFVIILSTGLLYAQDPAKNDSVRRRYIAAATEIMASAHLCTLITLDENRRPVGRVLEAFDPDSNLVVWLGTNPRSRKVQQIKKNSEVTLFYFDTNTLSYVSIQGKAQLITDSLEKARHWKEEWKPFYKDLKEDYLLIKITPQFM
ncbi:MAG TPA: pyridoxamine 5'-phosphate oxidase family protein, partial [Chitinophagaceae bacterium]